jgi:hypothetical protein
MIYAQIINNTVVNIIVVEDLSVLPFLSKGFDAIIRVDNISPMPNIGDSYINGIFIQVS